MLLPALSPAADAPAPPAAEAFHQDIAWSADGQWLAYSELSAGSGDTDRIWRVWVVRPDGTGGRVIAEAARWVTWSPDGQRLAFATDRDGNSEIYSVRPDGSDLKRLTRHEARDTHPAWSPDGRRIAFVSSRAAHAEVHTMNADGSGILQVSYGKTGYAMDDSGRMAETYYAGDAHNPQWSPDGDWLVFYRSNGTEPDRIHVCAADGTGELSVTDDGLHNIYPSFVTDSLIAYASATPEGPKELVTIRLDGSERTRQLSIETFFARWSPDWTHIAYIGGSWPRTAIYVIRADGSGLRKVVN